VGRGEKKGLTATAALAATWRSGLEGGDDGDARAARTGSTRREWECGVSLAGVACLAWEAGAAARRPW
jgi:hypothetical protein